MTEEMAFDPIETARTVERSYREYLASTIHFDDPEYQRQLEDILAQPRFLAKGPYLEAADPFVKGRTPRQLIEEGILCGSMTRLGGGNPEVFDLDRPLYAHQEEAIRKARAGRNLVVATGTGSGKTECFLLPIINDILAEFEASEPTPGVRAMILYPMNALANDQLKRLRDLLAGTPITFGRYTGETPKQAAQTKTSAKNEVLSREAIRQTPPNILLTNYSMLEYLLLRPEDASLFRGAFAHDWRHIAIDEAHVYSGTLGTEIAYLLRRLKSRVAEEGVGELPALHCYATSATIGSEADRHRVAKFAQDLFGEPFSSDPTDLDVIGEKRDRCTNDLADVPWGSLPLTVWPALRKALDEKASPAKLVELLRDSGVPDTELGKLERTSNALPCLGSILLGEESTGLLVRRMGEGLLDLTDTSKMTEIGIDGLDGSDEGDVRTLASMVEVLSKAQRSESVPILSSRYHSFLGAPEGLFINLWTKTLIGEKAVSEVSEEGYVVPTYEVAVCRHCGQAYILGEPSAMPGDTRGNRWLSPKRNDDLADEGLSPRKYFRLIPEGEEADEGEDFLWLCPICGSLSCSSTGGTHLFDHEVCDRIRIGESVIANRNAIEWDAKCRHCGYTSPVAIQPMRVSPEAVGSVVCYDLVRDLPPFEREGEDKQSSPSPTNPFHQTKPQTEGARAGSVICFSDKRQDAAFFAPAMTRTYDAITRRQIILEAIKAKSAGRGWCSPYEVISWISDEGFRAYPSMLKGGRGAEALLAEAWVLDEMEAEDSRNSLEGLGLIKVEATETNERMDSVRARFEECYCEGLKGEDDLSWLCPDDLLIFARVGLESLRKRGALAVSPGVPDLRSAKASRANRVTESDSSQGSIAFAGSPNGSVFANSRGSFVKRYVANTYGKEIADSLTKDSVRKLLKTVYGLLRDCLDSLNLLENPSDSGFYINMNAWRLAPSCESDEINWCPICGCSYWVETKRTCLTTRCPGSPRRTKLSQLKDKDRYYKQTYRDAALPIDIEEHSAQLSRKRAGDIQQEFLDGKVNVLSCTTTFELGVDVGDLRAVFLRNVPPSPANYAQRAGRVGRRAGKPGYALTFCRLRSHDRAFFANPESMIHGKTIAPACHLGNPTIALRHVFAIALSEFFRHEVTHGRVCSDKYDDFLSLDEADPEGMEELRTYLSTRPRDLEKQLSEVFVADDKVGEELGIMDWSWCEKLVGNEGKLARLHLLKNGDYLAVQEAMDKSDKKGNLGSILDGLKEEKTISILAGGGILPKYGFPTDLVELRLDLFDSDRRKSPLQLQRGLRQAIYEYAPGSEVVASGRLWRSTGVRKIRGRKLVVRRYGKCDQCQNFVWPIDVGDSTQTVECPICKSSVEVRRTFLEPAFGFEGGSVKKGVGVRRPRATGYVKTFFSQHWPDESQEKTWLYPGGTLHARFAENGQLCAINDNAGLGFEVCSYCGGSSANGKEITHQRWCACKDNPSSSHYNALGTAFRSDVLELTISFTRERKANEADYESAMWAIFAAAAELLEIPESELGGTHYGKDGSWSIMIYDSVPGGAGHAQRLYERRLPELLERAYAKVHDCTCSEDTCCYGCIANFYNQNRQDKLSRGAALKVLGALLNPSGGLTGLQQI